MSSPQENIASQPKEIPQMPDELYRQIFPDAPLNKAPRFIKNALAPLTAETQEAIIAWVEKYNQENPHNPLPGMMKIGNSIIVWDPKLTKQLGDDKIGRPVRGFARRATDAVFGRTNPALVTADSIDDRASVEIMHALFRPLFTVEKIREQVPKFRSHAKTLVSRIINAGGVSDEPIKYYTFASMMSMFFGVDNIPEGLKGLPKALQKTIGRTLVMKATGTGVFLRESVRQQKEALHKQLDKLMDIANPDGTLFGRIRQATTIEGLTIRGKQVIKLAKEDQYGIFLELASAGSVTTASTLESVLTFLGSDKNSHILSDLLQELEENIDRIDEYIMEEGTFINSIFIETLRLCPPLNFKPRAARISFDLDGYHIEEGTQIYIGMGARHRLPEYFDEPNEFNPYRFQGQPGLKGIYYPDKIYGNQELMNEFGNSILAPFNDVTRSIEEFARQCTGKNLAPAKVKAAIVEILLKIREGYKLSVSHDGFVMKSAILMPRKLRISLVKEG